MLLKKLFKQLGHSQSVSTTELFKFGAIAGLVEVVYIVLVATFMLLAQSLFPDTPSGVIVGIVSFLTVFVFSATVSGVIMLGLPLYFAIEKKYKEALIILLSSGFSLMAILIIMMLGKFFI
ncbi:hypothetical protein GW933_00775 [Candidatus Falkowbacteria bacterium]|uniref:Uncharacterized protein n=1 Tax=Candidatus Buchananbacteria bacterium CG10_big_fil_rev_8_21_14_0_10_33_19 TaxID=1974525 RepID=A0A2H0W363_9BACT|nr:hypothetical protein [Candidatus Falkowbacteria bacterium]PIS05788.1 MAG: hypothetical protein COT80_03400 [Candidatus Buchananbacteria bacterium CG10_big_fil_rev_8_21_14_0_10_33_19]